MALISRVMFEPWNYYDTKKSFNFKPQQLKQILLVDDLTLILAYSQQERPW